LVPHEEPKPHANGSGLTRMRPKPTDALPAGNVSQCEIADCRAKFCHAVTRSQCGHAARRTSAPSLKIGPTLIGASYSVLVVMDDGLLSTAVLILFFDDRGSVGLARLPFFDDGGAVAVSILAGLSYSHAGAIWTDLNANADLISKAGVAMALTRAAANTYFFIYRTPFDSPRRGMSGCDNSFQERRRVSRDLTASGARTRPTV
jgi:hypothetical protein